MNTFDSERKRLEALSVADRECARQTAWESIKAVHALDIEPMDDNELDAVLASVRAQQRTSAANRR
jgi:hypothetical protein